MVDLWEEAATISPPNRGLTGTRLLGTKLTLVVRSTACRVNPTPDSLLVRDERTWLLSPQRLFAVASG